MTHEQDLKDGLATLAGDAEHESALQVALTEEIERQDMVRFKATLSRFDEMWFASHCAAAFVTTIIVGVAASLHGWPRPERAAAIALAWMLAAFIYERRRLRCASCGSAHVRCVAAHEATFQRWLSYSEPIERCPKCRKFRTRRVRRYPEALY